MSARDLLRDVARRWRLYRVQHAVSRWRDAIAARPAGADVDICYVVAPQNRGWILDRVARELSASYEAGRSVVSEPGALPPARVYFFTHPNLFLRDIGWRGRPGRTRAVFVTHTYPENLDEIASGLRTAQFLVCMNSAVRESLVARGVPRQRTEVFIGGADEAQFTPAEGARPRRILLSSGYYERKAPFSLLALVRALPGEEFLLVGRDWRRWSQFTDLARCPNFEYVEPAYDQYPAQYRHCDVFLSLSSLEGGPIPLIEAMLTDLVPVVTRTGFAPDIIEHGKNGFLFDPGAPVAAVIPLLEAARERRFAVRATALDYTWNVFSRRVNDALHRLIASAV
jgi:glycosyltransferase involved in cell wall biosynthesis